MNDIRETPDSFVCKSEDGVFAQQHRFKEKGNGIVDHWTNLMWSKDANVAEVPLLWEEALEFIKTINITKYGGYSDWRLPNRRELFSLISHNHANPSLPEKHMFINVFSGYYWTSTTCVRLPRQAWYVHLGGGRVVKGMKQGASLVWPVRSWGKNQHNIPRTGQQNCFNSAGETIACDGTGQDGHKQTGFSWPQPRFTHQEDGILDHLTGQIWMPATTAPDDPMDWNGAKAIIDDLNEKESLEYSDWRLPTIRELESLTDMGQHSPAMPQSFPLEKVNDWYWSSTTSAYNSDYAWVLYTVDGMVGVGYKSLREFFVLPVRGKIHDRLYLQTENI